MSDENLISKTRRKRQMLDLQDVGKALTRLQPDQLARIEMPESLRQAVTECRGMTKHEAIRRQLQYIGKLMRKLDCGPIADRLESMHAPTHRQTALFHRAEQWRKALLDEPGAAERFAQQYPRADSRRLQELAAAAIEERRAERPPKRFRELFQVINTILQDHEKTMP